MTPLDVRDVIEQTANLVETHYVLPEAGGEIARSLRAMTVTTREVSQFAEDVTRQLRSFNGDGHLSLRYSETELPVVDQDGAADYAALVRKSEETWGGIAKVERLEAGIGYLDIRPMLFLPPPHAAEITAAMTLLASANALIIDVRRCVGGDPSTVAFALTYLFGDDPVHLGDLYEREGDRVRQFWTQAFVPGPRFGPDKPVYVLTGAGTFSGGEDIAYTLQQHGRATVVGERTGGGAHPRRGFRVHPHLMAAIPAARPINAISGTNWEGVGVTPDVPAASADALEVALDVVRQGLRLG